MSKDNIIAIASGKGGVGKTWVSTTIAHVFANSGRKALLFDGDIGLANIDVQLGLQPKVDLGDVFAGKVTLKDSITYFKNGNYDIIAGCSGSGLLANLPPERIVALKQGLTELASGYDIVLLDIGAGIEGHVQAIMQLTDRCIVVLNDEPTSLTDAYSFIKKMRFTNPKLDIQIIVNMAENQRDGLKTFGAIKNTCELFLKFTPRLAGIIRRDPKVKESIRTQTPVLVNNTKSMAAADVAALAVKLMAR